MSVLTFPQPGEHREEATACANQPCENKAYWWDMPNMRGRMVRSSIIILCEEHAALHIGLVRINDMKVYEQELDAWEKKWESLDTLSEVYLFNYEEGVKELGIDVRDMKYVYCTPDYLHSREGFWMFVMHFHMKNGMHGMKRFSINSEDCPITSWWS